VTHSICTCVCIYICSIGQVLREGVRGRWQWVWQSATRTVRMSVKVSKNVVVQLLQSAACSKYERNWTGTGRRCVDETLNTAELLEDGDKLLGMLVKIWPMKLGVQLLRFETATGCGFYAFLRGGCRQSFLKLVSKHYSLSWLWLLTVPVRIVCT
jgi:hypothetical protein